MSSSGSTPESACAERRPVPMLPLAASSSARPWSCRRLTARHPLEGLRVGLDGGVLGLVLGRHRAGGLGQGSQLGAGGHRRGSGRRGLKSGGAAGRPAGRYGERPARDGEPRQPARVPGSGGAARPLLGATGAATPAGRGGLETAGRVAPARHPRRGEQPGDEIHDGGCVGAAAHHQPQQEQPCRPAAAGPAAVPRPCRRCRSVHGPTLRLRRAESTERPLRGG